MTVCQSTTTGERRVERRPACEGELAGGQRLQPGRHVLKHRPSPPLPSRLNGHNVHWAWALLRRERRQAAEAIADCRELSSPAEFEGLVQRNAGANAGLDYAGLGALLRCIAGRSLEALAAAAAAEEAAGEDATAAAAALAEGPCRGRWYHCFRLQRAAAVLRQLLAEQRRIDGEAAAAADAAGGAGEAPFHAVEAAANAACLEAIQERLRALGLPAAV